jgi:hypothetical protein
LLQGLRGGYEVNLATPETNLDGPGWHAITGLRRPPLEHPEREALGSHLELRRQLLTRDQGDHELPGQRGLQDVRVEGGVDRRIDWQ